MEANYKFKLGEQAKLSKYVNVKQNTVDKHLVCKQSN